MKLLKLSLLFFGLSFATINACISKRDELLQFIENKDKNNVHLSNKDKLFQFTEGAHKKMNSRLISMCKENNDQNDECKNEFSTLNKRHSFALKEIENFETQENSIIKNRNEKNRLALINTKYKAHHDTEWEEEYTKQIVENTAEAQKNIDDLFDDAVTKIFNIWTQAE